MPLYILLILQLVLSGTLSAQNSEYHIYKGSDKVGSIQVSRSTVGERVLYNMSSHSEFSLIWKQVVRTSASTEYLGGSVSSCHSAVKVNDTVRDSSSMSVRSGTAHWYVHPGEVRQQTEVGEWTTARMYFEEPVATESVFVESVLQKCPLRPSGNGVYTLTFPNSTQNHYVYRDGVLQEIQVIRPFFDLKFRKVQLSAAQGGE